MRGICALTLEEGKFVASHLIPKALTKPSISGCGFTQIESGKKPIRRWDSWYDDCLVSEKGENLLTELDTWAIEKLRECKLIWSGWGEAQSLDGHFTVLPNSPWGIRKIENVDTLRLRLFFLSLLWRAAATKRIEFEEVKMPADDLETLRQMLLSSQAQPISFYRIGLTQLSTKGVIHNMAPILEYKKIPSLIPGIRNRLERIYRFYFDGLVAHFHLPCGEADDQNYGSLVLGATNDIVLSTVTYEKSFEKEQLEMVQFESSLFKHS